MPIAPSFQDYIRVTNTPFCKNGKMYITVENPKTNNRRDVRWYSDSEYAKAYGKKEESSPLNPEAFKQARGFSEGPILVIRKNKAEDEDWLKLSPARYAVGIGWYFPSTAKIPTDIPSHFKFLFLGWNEFYVDGIGPKKPTELSYLLNKKLNNKEFVTL